MMRNPLDGAVIIEASIGVDRKHVRRFLILFLPERGDAFIIRCPGAKESITVCRVGSYRLGHRRELYEQRIFPKER